MSEDAALLRAEIIRLREELEAMRTTLYHAVMAHYDVRRAFREMTEVVELDSYLMSKLRPDYPAERMTWRIEGAREAVDSLAQRLRQMRGDGLSPDGRNPPMPESGA